MCIYRTTSFPMPLSDSLTFEATWTPNNFSDQYVENTTNSAYIDYRLRRLFIVYGIQMAGL